MTLLLVSLRLVGVLGFWGLRTLKLEMSESDDVLCLFGVFPCLSQVISTVQSPYEAICRDLLSFFNLETRSVTCHTSGHLHFQPTLRYQVLEAVHCGGFPPFSKQNTREATEWSHGWGWEPGCNLMEKMMSKSSHETTQIHQEIPEQSPSNQSIPNN